MNKVIEIGRLVRDAEVKYSQGEKSTAIARFTLAVDRRFKNDSTQDADFITCIAFGKLGEFFEKYGNKGTKFAITGRLQTGSYTNREGQKVYTTDVVVEEAEFAESKASRVDAGLNAINAPVQVENDGFMNVPDDMEDLPFGSI